jgi:hypothetical protein
MGVDCSLTLPNNARLRDVANAIGILAGLKPEAERLSGSDGFFFRVPGVTVKSSRIETLAEIHIQAPDGESLVDGEKHHWVLYHFEFEVPTDDPNVRTYARGIMPRSTRFWIAMCCKLADVFGGVLDFNDCDDSGQDYVKPEHPLNGAVNGAAWDAQQRRIFELAPLTKKDMTAVEMMAAYR